MVICQSCYRQNPDGSRFCQFCGTVFPAESIAAPQQQPPPPAQPPPQAYRPVDAGGNIGQLGGGGTAGGNIWGPFAGYGTRGRHASWLLDNQGDKANALHEAVTQRFQQREIPAATMNWQSLAAQGVLVERRPFYFVRRGITTVALYIAQFGRDLYISQVTYAKGPFSNVRIGILAFMILFQLFFMFSFTDALSNAAQEMLGSLSLLGGGRGDGGSAMFTIILCCVGPLGFLNTVAWLILLPYSAYKYLTEKDFLAILRRPPNEFQIDDTIAMEKAVEETVRQSLDAIGIDATLMTPTPENTGNARRLI